MFLAFDHKNMYDWRWSLECFEVQPVASWVHSHLWITESICTFLLNKSSFWDLHLAFIFCWLSQRWTGLIKKQCPCLWGGWDTDIFIEMSLGSLCGMCFLVDRYTFWSASVHILSAFHLTLLPRPLLLRRKNRHQIGKDPSVISVGSNFYRNYRCSVFHECFQRGNGLERSKNPRRNPPNQFMSNNWRMIKVC